MRPIFIGGCPRSGTTLLGALIGAHSRCLCVPEMQFHWDLRRQIGRSGGRMSVEDLTRRLASHWRWRIWETPLDPDRFWSAWDEPPEDARRNGSVTYRQPSRVTRVRFEDLVSDPVDVLRRLCPALGLNWEEGLGRATEFRLPGFNRAQHRLVARAPDASRARGWQEELTAREVEVFESSAGDLLRSLGYELEYGDDARRPTRAELWRFAMVGSARGAYNRARMEWRKRRMTTFRWNVP